MKIDKFSRVEGKIEIFTNFRHFSQNISVFNAWINKTYNLGRGIDLYFWTSVCDVSVYCYQ